MAIRSPLSPYPGFQDQEYHRPGRISQFYICFYQEYHFSLYAILDTLDPFDPLNRQPAALNNSAGVRFNAPIQ